MSLIDVDPAPLRGRVVKAATLHLKLAGRRSRCGGSRSAASGPSGSRGPARAMRGSRAAATFRHRRHPDLPGRATGPAGDLCHVILGNGGTGWGMADASPPDADGWQRIAVDPRSSWPRAAGL